MHQSGGGACLVAACSRHARASGGGGGSGGESGRRVGWMVASGDSHGSGHDKDSDHGNDNGNGNGHGGRNKSKQQQQHRQQQRRRPRKRQTRRLAAAQAPSMSGRSAARLACVPRSAARPRPCHSPCGAAWRQSRLPTSTHMSRAVSHFAFRLPLQRTPHEPLVRMPDAETSVCCRMLPAHAGSVIVSRPQVEVTAEGAGPHGLREIHWHKSHSHPLQVGALDGSDTRYEACNCRIRLGSPLVEAAAHCVVSIALY